MPTFPSSPTNGQSTVDGKYIYTDPPGVWRLSTEIAVGGIPFTGIVSDLAPELGGQLDANSESIIDVGAIESYSYENVFSGSTETLNTANFSVFEITMDQNCTFTFANPAPDNQATMFTLILKGGYDPTWPANVTWNDGTEPTYTTPSVYTFLTTTEGLTWYGAQAGKAFA